MNNENEYHTSGYSPGKQRKSEILGKNIKHQIEDFSYNQAGGGVDVPRGGNSGHNAGLGYQGYQNRGQGRASFNPNYNQGGFQGQSGGGLRHIMQNIKANLHSLDNFQNEKLSELIVSLVDYYQIHIKKMKGIIFEKQQELAISREKAESMKNMLQSIRHENDRKLAEREEQMKGQSMKVLDLEREITKLRIEVDRKDGAEFKIRQEEEDLKEQVRKVEREKGNLEDMVRLKEEEISHLRDRVGKLEDENIELRRERGELRLEVEGLKEIEKQPDYRERDRDDFEKNTKYLVSEINSLKRELYKAKSVVQRVSFSANKDKYASSPKKLYNNDDSKLTEYRRERRSLRATGNDNLARETPKKQHSSGRRSNHSKRSGNGNYEIVEFDRRRKSLGHEWDKELATNQPSQYDQGRKTDINKAIGNIRNWDSPAGKKVKRDKPRFSPVVDVGFRKKQETANQNTERERLRQQRRQMIHRNRGGSLSDSLNLPGNQPTGNMFRSRMDYNIITANNSQNQEENLLKPDGFRSVIPAVSRLEMRKNSLKFELGDLYTQDLERNPNSYLTSLQKKEAELTSLLLKLPSRARTQEAIQRKQNLERAVEKHQKAIHLIKQSML